MLPKRISGLEEALDRGTYMKVFAEALCDERWWLTFVYVWVLLDVGWWLPASS